MKRLALLIVTLVVLVGLVVSTKLVQRQQNLSSKAAGASVVYQMSTGNNGAVTTGTPFTVNVSIDPSADNYSVSAGTVGIKYDPNLLTFNSATVGKFFGQFFPTDGTYGTSEMLNKTDTSTPGVVKVSLGAPCPTVIPAPRGPNDTTPCGVNNKPDVFTTLSFTPKTAGSTNLYFDSSSAVAALGQTANVVSTSSLSQTLALTITGGTVQTHKACQNNACVTVTGAGTDTCTTNANCTTTGGQGSLNFKIKFEGAIPGTSTMSKVAKVKVVLGQNGTAKYTFDGNTAAAVTPDSNGIYSGAVSGITPGTYDVLIKEATHLSKKFAAITIASGTNAQDWSADTYMMTAGDANNDNRVDILDFGVLAGDYLNAANGPTSTADFNLDGRVDILDFGILAGNYLKTGDSL